MKVEEARRITMDFEESRKLNIEKARVASEQAALEILSEKVNKFVEEYTEETIQRCIEHNARNGLWTVYLPVVDGYGHLETDYIIEKYGSFLENYYKPQFPDYNVSIKLSVFGWVCVVISWELEDE